MYTVTEDDLKTLEFQNLSVYNWYTLNDFKQEMELKKFQILLLVKQKNTSARLRNMKKYTINQKLQQPYISFHRWLRRDLMACLGWNWGSYEPQNASIKIQFWNFPG